MKTRIILTIVISALATIGSSAAGPITGKILGKFHRNCLLCDGPLKTHIKTSKVWCAWQDGKVLIHVQMRNTSVEHVTVNSHPSSTRFATAARMGTVLARFNRTASTQAKFAN